MYRSSQSSLYSGSKITCHDDSLAGNHALVVVLKNSKRGSIIYIDNIYVKLVTDATVATRYINLRWYNVSGQLVQFLRSDPISASSTYYINLAEGVGYMSQGNAIVMPLTRKVLDEGHSLQMQIDAGVAGDTWDYHVEARMTRVKSNV